MSLRKFACLFAMVLLSAALLAAQTDPAYANGYSTGYGLGQLDKAAHRASNPHKFSAYQLASAGYTASYGSCADYRASFKSGFSDGYGDGYANRTASLTAAAPAPAATSCDAAAAPAAPPAPAMPAAEVSQLASGNGYREGYTAGQNDANASASFNLTGQAAYSTADGGYSAAMGPLAAYRSAFQNGFASGYDDGFHHRLYNSSMGGRADAPPAPAANPATSGVYGSSIVVAAGTEVQGTLNQALSTKTSTAGETFTLTVSTPIYVGAAVAIPAGSTIQGTIESLKRGGHFGGHASMTFRYDTLTLPGQSPLPLAADFTGAGSGSASTSQENTVNGASTHKAADAMKGAAAGAGIGALIGGGKGAVDGAAYGALGATLAEIMMHNRDVTLAAGTIMRLKLDSPLTLPRAQ